MYNQALVSVVAHSPGTRARLMLISDTNTDTAPSKGFLFLWKTRLSQARHVLCQTLSSTDSPKGTESKERNSGNDTSERRIFLTGKWENRGVGTCFVKVHMYCSPFGLLSSSDISLPITNNLITLH